jgi:hypothetical protein
MTKEVIAVLMPDMDAGPAEDAWPGPQVRVRREDGAVVPENVTDGIGDDDGQADRYRKADPIVDPRTKEVIGHEPRPVAKLA